MSIKPPSYNRQSWLTILIVSSLVWLLSVSFILFISWTWFVNWPSLGVHAGIWINSIKAVFFENYSQPWLSYWRAMDDHGLLIAFVFHFGLANLFAFYLAYLAGKRFYISGGKDSYFHADGPILFKLNTALNHAKKAAKKEGGVLGLKLHPKLQISRSREAGNVLVLGNQGTGKTVFLLPLISQVIDRGERAFIYDEKREFTAHFFKKKTSVLIAPWDKRGTPWNIQADACNAVQAKLIADQLIGDSRDPLWSEGARSIFAGMIEVLNHTEEKWGWVELANIMLLNEVELKSQLTAHYPRAERFVVEDSKTTQSFFAQLNGSLGWIHTLAEAWPTAYKNGFSMGEWVGNPDTLKPIIIVQADKRYKDIGAPLANTLIRIMTSYVLAQTNCSKRELWLFIDELANLPKNDALGEWMSLGRSKGCRICGGTQSISQLKQIYTDNGADTLLNMFTIFATMRLGAAGETAAYTAKVFGERLVERRTSSAGPQGNTSQNWHGETVPLVRASDLVHLPQPNKHGVEGYILIPGFEAVYKLCWPYASIPKVSQEHCPASWIISNTSKSLTKKTESNTTSRRIVRKTKENNL